MSLQDRRALHCQPSWQGQAFDQHTGKLVPRSFPTESAAKAWRNDAVTAIRSGKLRAGAPKAPTVSAALEDLLERMEAGKALDRSGKPYKPATVRSYRQAVRRYIAPSAVGGKRLTDVRRADMQRLVDDLRATTTLSPSTIHNKLDPLRVVFRRAIRDEVIHADPMLHLELPRVRGRRERVASPADAERLLDDALNDAERPLWATAFYAGLRVGELRALRWQNVDFDRGVIGVRRAWDDVEGEIEVKSDAGRRDIPIAGRLRAELVRHKLATGRGPDDLVFGRTPVDAFVRSTVRSRANAAWKAAGLTALTPHEARHTCASYLIAAGLNAKQIQTYIGHSDVRTTYNVYGHLMPGGEGTAAAQLDAYLGGPKAGTG